MNSKRKTYCRKDEDTWIYNSIIRDIDDEDSEYRESIRSRNRNETESSNEDG